MAILKNDENSSDDRELNSNSTTGLGIVKIRANNLKKKGALPNMSIHINDRLEYIRNIIHDNDTRTLDLRLLRQIRQDIHYLRHLVPHGILTPITSSYQVVEELLERYRILLISVVNCLLLYGWPEESIHQAFHFDMEEIRRRPIEPDTISIKESKLMRFLNRVP